MKLTKRNKVRIIIAMALSGIFFIIAYMPIIAAILLMVLTAAVIVELTIFILEEIVGFDFSDE